VSAATSRTVRGEMQVEIPLRWRLDGPPGAAADTPLVLALHGQTMDENRFALLLQPLFQLPCRFLIPRAPWPVDVRSEGRIGWSWYPYDGDQEHFLVELARTEAWLASLLARAEAEHGLRPRRRFLLGFSQGGYCGAVIALRHLDLFDGLVVAGARVKNEILATEMRAAAARRFPVLLLHGLRDAHVLPEAAERSRDALAAAAVPVELRTFDAGHSLGREHAAAIAAWLEARLA
jgi:phospholipase/carboxylesterase